MFSLFRNPLLRLVGQLWWLPILAPFAAWGFAGAHGKQVALTVDAVYLLSIAGIVVTAVVHGNYVEDRWQAIRRRLKHRFLCPHCFQFGDFDFACGGCGEKLVKFPVFTNGHYVNDCPKCQATLFTYDGADDRNVLAHCWKCRQNSERGIRHQRSVRVLATFHPGDFASLCETIGAGRRSLGKIEYGYHDDGTQLTYVLNIRSILDEGMTFPRDHALFNVDAIWLNRAADDPLSLAREIDRYISQPQMSQSRPKTPSVFVAQPSLDQSARGRMEVLFPSITYDVGASGFGWVHAQTGGEQVSEDTVTAQQTGEPELREQAAGRQVP